MSVGFHSRRFPSLSTPNINEASSKDVTASLHRNVLSWAVWRGKEEKESVSLKAITHTSTSQTVAEIGSYSGVSNLFRAASVPDVAERSPKSACSSISIATQRILPLLCNPQDPAYRFTPTQPVKVSTLQETFIPTSPRVSNSQPDVCRKGPTIVMSNDFGQAFSHTDGLAVRDQGKRKVQLVRRVSYTESDRKQDEIGGLLMSAHSHRSCIHLDVPLRSISSVVFLDKSLTISLVELEERRSGQPTQYRSSLSVRISVQSCRRSSADNKAAKINEGYGRPRTAMLGRNKRNGRESVLGHCRSPLSQHRGHRVEPIAPAHGVNSKADDSDTQQQHCTALGLLSFKDTKPGRQKGNADEKAFPIRSNFKQHTSNIGPVESRTCSKQARNDKTEEQQEVDGSPEPRRVSLKKRPQADYLKGTPKTLSLKEALELFRPDFISRSQGRVRRLEQRVSKRRLLQDSNPDLVQGLREERDKQKRNCTTPDPLSDNLFKPRERSISGREMQLRSRRIYKKLPEVTKKKEEEKKRTISQTNRLRADIFKKRLLDQILQR
ncbi:hypothetical protein OYC64_012486 [Pagothenia borchgrevinki]|uniref:ALMS motif domain-containing protein n=1 Tax=Pagothenia borchgrevinki TaxID=8213 RepID=A0ABD2G8Q1_PAGBO